MQYYNWIIYEKFIPLTKTGKDEELVACGEMATEIIFSLLDHWTRFGCTLMYTLQLNTYRDCFHVQNKTHSEEIHLVRIVVSSSYIVYGSYRHGLSDR